MLRDVGSLDQQFQLLEALGGKPDRDPGELTAQRPQLELLANQSLEGSSSATVKRAHNGSGTARAHTNVPVRCKCSSAMWDGSEAKLSTLREDR